MAKKTCEKPTPENCQCMFFTRHKNALQYSLSYFLRSTRTWIQQRFRNGSSIIWGSDEELVGGVTARDLDDLAKKLCTDICASNVIVDRDIYTGLVLSLAHERLTNHQFPGGLIIDALRTKNYEFEVEGVQVLYDRIGQLMTGWVMPEKEDWCKVEFLLERILRQRGTLK